MKQIDVLLKVPCFLYNPTNVGNLVSGSSSFSKPSLDIWKVLIHIMLKPSMQDFMHDLTSVGDECYCLMVSTFLVLSIYSYPYFYTYPFTYIYI